MFHIDLIVIKVSLGLILCLFFNYSESSGQDANSIRVWQKEDTTKLSDTQVKYLLSKCIEHLFRGTFQFGREEGMPALGSFIDNDFVEDIFLTFDHSSNEDMLFEYEKYRYLDFSYKQDISQNICGFRPAYKVPVQYLENGKKVLESKEILNHMGHITISDLYLHRDLISVLIKVNLKSFWSPMELYDSQATIIRFYAKRCYTGEIYVLATDNTEMLRPLKFKGINIDRVSILSPNYGCPLYGPRLSGNTLRRIVDE
jgi:hypothetical protein